MTNRSYNRKTGIRSPDLFVIATEGVRTESAYFDGIKQKLRDSRLNMLILTRDESGRSNPTQVIEQLDEYKKENRIGPRDLLCLVIDRDSQSTSVAQLRKTYRLCTQKGYLLALSNPCFELWLLLHLVDLSEYNQNQLKDLLENKRQKMKREVQSVNRGFDYTNLQIDDFWPHIELAVARAEYLDDGKPWPEGKLGTTVHRLISKLEPIMRKL